MGALVGGLASGIGGIIQGNQAAKAQRTAAAAQTAAAKLAAEEARFRPIGVTNAFGSSNFQFDPTTGRMSGAGYEVNPQLAAMRNQLMGFAGNTNVGDAQTALQQGQQGLFDNMANAGDIAGQTQRLFSQRQDLMAPQRERDLAGLRNQSYQQGRSGLSVGGTDAGGFAAANPEMQAFFNAQRQQDNSMMAQSEQDARNYRNNDMQALGGLFGLQQQSMNPMMQFLQGSQGIDNMGKSSFDTSMMLGQANQNPTGANAMYNGGMAAASTNLGATNSKNAGINSLFGLGSSLLGSALNSNMDWGDSAIGKMIGIPSHGFANGLGSPSSRPNMGGG